ncbi:meiosis regulator and mRNA stability factor 1 isoform X1 [Seriola lalandi dorsalis]|uniref:Meiosis regulator and mRNA stability factor 1 n=1 Tax=Seriola lalandi dorsalis TaxID=1841481 RepID=A0A3B4X4I8_SERLL|nr:meiosis regulator and mRNA stability factor 1 isoform X1 [Seriola lalandi dorsalis]XP_023277797.1 meiosis regulator and mRNA stability factor 1 isoform X1 [Seriola lalandi dorsalis]
MMERLGKERSICSASPFPWLSHPKTEASTLLWKLKDCFSTTETTTPHHTDKEKNYMESRKPVLELKDVPPPPPPPHHTSSSQPSQPFSLAPLPLPHPRLPPPPQLTQGSHQQQPPHQQLEGATPKVSICTHCDYCSTDGYGLLGGGGVVGSSSSSIAGVVSLYIAPGSVGAPISNSSISRSGPCSVTSSVHQYKNNLSCGREGETLDPLLSLGYKPQLPSSVATSQPVSSHPYLPCCSGLLHTYPAAPLPCSQPSFFPSSAPLASSLPSVSTLPVSLHGSCLASSGYYTCGMDCSPSARRSQRSTLGDHPTPTTITTTTTSAHFCSNPMHLNVERTVCVKGAHYCQECFLKPMNGLASESDKIWPNVPAPQTAPIPIPICNGCGTSSDSMMLMPSTSLGKIGQKYGSPENSGPENIPPVGVFWDIENCSVPSGRSAGAVVQRIRSRFFQGHREAEFICVCDISKESKAVIQELNNCQVTVAHINATAKNAADDKLRQSLRRFAETHTAPATVVLVSSDVNFASELSDLRHRHGFQVILVHGNHTSSALLQHAHRHVAFQEITADLPPRMLVKAQPSFNLLYVHNLPVNCDKSLRNAVKLRLRRLSDNCGGKVLGMSQGTAVLRFGSPEAAARARKRMENEDVYGRRISLSFSPRPRDDASLEPEIQSQPHHLLQALPQPYQSQDSVFAPPPSISSFSFLPLEKPRSPRRPRRATRPCHTPGPVPERPYSPRRGCSGPPGGAPAKPRQELGSFEGKSRMGFHQLDKGRAASSSPHSNGETGAMDQLSKPGLTGESMYRRRREGSNPRSLTESPVEQGDRSSGEFQISTPSAFSKLNLHRSFSPLVLSQGSWSSRSVSPCLSSRSSPILAAPRSPCPEGPPEPFSEGTEVQVGNLDYRMSRKDLQQTLHDTFSRYGRVKAVELSPHTDYQLKATVQMLSLQHAISAVSGLHRYKIGSKRIQVSLVTGGSSKSLAMLSTEIISILQDAPANCLPLFKFTEIYEKKYCRKLVVGDLYRLPEVVAVREQGGSRLVCLLPSSQIRQSPLGSSQSQEGSSSASGSPVVFEELEYHEPVCRQHYAQQDFSEADFDPDSYKIPFVVMSLSTLASEVHSLLQSHEGTLPLLSFPDCYAAKFSPLQLGNETLEGGVPLEHLITCVPSITIVTAQNGFKVIKWIHNKPPAPNQTEPWIQRCKSPVGNPQLIQFSREIIDLLKSQPSCIMPISKFIPSYHHHFAKQCRVSDYGYSKLLELLEAVPHVLQILGMGTKRLLTLTHRAQVKRFTQDLLKLLKFQASKQVAIKDFMQAYHWCFSRDWRVIDYGICDLMDLMTEIPETTITITHHTTDTVISVPKRERTVEEMERTKQFAKEVVDLLRHQPHCRMPFSKFIPTYHHHFGRQCKLSYYGFTKLMELFEAIPDVLMVLECGEEKVLTLTEVERIKALAAQLVKLLRAQKNSSLPVCQLLTEYSKTFGYGLRLQDYDASSLPALLTKLCHVVKVVDGSEGREVQLINRKSLRSLTSQLLALLMSQEEEQVTKGLKVEELSHHYLTVHAALLNPCEYGFLSLSELLKSLPYLVELYYEEIDEDCKTGNTATDHGEEWVRLTRLYQFARNIRALLHTYHYNQIFLTEFQGAYKKFTGCSLEPRSYGYASTDELLSAIPQVVWIKGHGHKRIIVLKNDMKARTSSSVPNSPQPEENTETPRGSPVSNTFGAQSPGGDEAAESELLCLTSPVDLLCGPVPSCLPSPQLHPDPVLLQQADLIRFEERTPPPTDERDELEVAAAAVTDSTEDSAVTKLPTAPNMKTPLSMDSPSRRATRSRIKLAANFSFTAGL